MTEVFNLGLDSDALPKLPDSSSSVPLQFRELISRHHKHLIDLSAALSGAGATPEMAAVYVEAARASFREGLAASIDQREGAQ